MKKYFLKIAGISIVAVPLVTMIACNENPENNKDAKDKVIDADLVGAKNIIINVESLKNREELEAALKGKAKDAIVTKDEIGYIEPTNLPYGVTIDSDKYTLEEPMTTKAKTFKVKVTIKKGTGTNAKTTIKIITITPKPYDFTTVKSKFPNSFISSKTKNQLTNIVGKLEGELVSPTDMGYDNPPGATDLDGVTVKYKMGKDILEDVNTDQQFKVVVTLTKGLGAVAENATKEITIKAAYDFTAIKNKFIDATSSKTKAQLLSATGTDGIKGLKVDDIVTKNQMGYTEPINIPTGVIVSYKMKSLLGTGKTFKVVVHLKKGVSKDKKEITITAAYDFTIVKSKFPISFISSKTKNQLTNIVGKKEGELVSPNEIGYDNPPAAVDLDGVTVWYKMGKDILEDVNTDQQFTVVATLKRGGSGTTAETTTKEITIKTAYDFTTFKDLFKDLTSSKTKKQLTNIVGKLEGEPVSPTDMGYDNPPAAVDLDGVTVGYKIGSDTLTSDTNDQQFKVVVTLTKVIGTTAETATKEITIKAQPILISELNKFNGKAISTKSKVDLVDFLKSKNVDDILQNNDIGYEEPSNLDSSYGIIKEYSLKQKFNSRRPNDYDFAIKLTLSKEGEKVDKIIFLKTKDWEFLAEKMKFKDQESTKTKNAINLPNVEQNVQIEQIGYSKPSNQGTTFNISYKLFQGWHGTDNNQFKIKVFIAKDGNEVTKIITITAKST